MPAARPRTALRKAPARSRSSSAGQYLRWQRNALGAFSRWRGTAARQPAAAAAAGRSAPLKYRCAAHALTALANSARLHASYSRFAAFARALWLRCKGDNQEC